ncbi:MAG: T9SS type A sorting domain-containing protein [Tannerellaceae bacterium]|jgi:exo-beta-1,3-glucanase (GH17 family)|nr:T9SS type A sorting domain-containing protein [Tannerellaceae bacterium]
MKVKISILLGCTMCMFASLSAQSVSKSEVKDNRIIVTAGTGEKTDYKIYGFCYSVDQNGRGFEASFDSHLALLKSVHANSIRTYRPLAAYNGNGSINYEKTRRMFDKLAEAGMTVSIGFDLNQDLLSGLYKTYLDELGNHPALLGVLLGNEYNYHYIGSEYDWADKWFTKESWLANLTGAITNIRQRCNRFVGVVHGEIPTDREMAEYKTCGADIVMLNIYRGESFYNLFDQWKGLSANGMPLVVSEFGRSSVAANGDDASALQADWVKQLWNEIDSRLCQGVAGGYVFELVDESWKQGANELTGSEKHFGVFTEGGAPKAAANQLSQLWQNKADCGPVTSTASIPVSGLKVYPNPVEKGTSIWIETDTPYPAIEMYSLNGSLVKRQSTKGNLTEFTLSVPEGAYILKTGRESVKLIVK